MEGGSSLMNPLNNFEIVEGVIKESRALHWFVKSLTYKLNPKEIERFNHFFQKLSYLDELDFSQSRQGISTGKVIMENTPQEDNRFDGHHFNLNNPKEKEAARTIWNSKQQQKFDY